jgi:transposase
MFPGWQLRSGQKGGAGIGKTKRGKGCKIMALGDAHGLPIAIHAEAAAPAEIRLAEATLATRVIKEKPLRIIADKAYDSDPLRERLLKRQILLLAPHRRGRKRASFNDGRWLRRYRKRWKIERLFAWLHNFRRLVIRWEYHAANYLAFLQLGCAIILLRYL